MEETVGVPSYGGGPVCLPSVRSNEYITVCTSILWHISINMFMFLSPAIHCSLPPLVDHASSNTSDVIFGTTANITCDIGYTFNDGVYELTRCEASGEWTPLPSTCERAHGLID